MKLGYYRTMRALTAAAGVLLAGTADAQTEATATLPAPVSMTYGFTHGGLKIGTNTRSLTRDTDGSYRYRVHTRPQGMARMFTRVEWFEEGRFEIIKGRVRPLEHLKYRTGSSRPHRHSAGFDWGQQSVTYADGRREPLPTDAQDASSMLYHIMLNPPRASGKQRVMINNGKRFRVNEYQLLRRETIDTVFGALDTLVVQWATAVDTDDSESLTAWLAVDKHNIPVRIITVEDGKTATMTLESLTGL